MPKSTLAVSGLAFLLAACGGGAPTARQDVAGPDNIGDGTSVPAATAAPGFNAADACATLPREKVAEVTGLKVTGTELSRVSPATAGTAGFSQCTYSFAGGSSLDFFARQSPIDDNTPEAIERTRQAQIDMMHAKTADVPGLGTAAFTVDKMHQLHVFIGGDRYIYFMSMRPPAGKPIAEVELALARMLIG